MKVSEKGLELLKLEGGWLRESISMSIEEGEKIVSNWVTVSITQNEFDALVSLIMSIGKDNFKRSTLLKQLNRGNKNIASNEFLKWIKREGKDDPDLLARRSMERQLFLTD